MLSPTVLIWSLPLTAGYVLAIPFAMITALPALGRWFARPGLCGIPEDFDPPAELRAIRDRGQQHDAPPSPIPRARPRRCRARFGSITATPARNAAMDALYGQFLTPGDLAFDIGSHVGDRISSFRRLGARVVALEPQPGPARAIRLIHGRDRR